MSEDRPYLQIPAPSAEDYEAYEEWIRQQEQKKQELEEQERVIVIDL